MKGETLETDLKFLSHGDFVVRLKNFAVTLEGHPALQNAPPCVPGPLHFRDYADRLTIAIAAAANGDKQKEKEREALREEAQRSLTFTGQFIVMFSTYSKDPTMLQTSGLELKQRTHSRAPLNSLPRQATKFTATNGEAPGTAILTVNKEPHMGSVELQATSADPNIEAEWYTLVKSYTCRTEAKGLDSVKRYYFRARFENALGVGPWSHIVSLIVH